MKYKLKRELPFAKAGERITIDRINEKYSEIEKLGGNGLYCQILHKDFDEWIEEVKPREFDLSFSSNGLLALIESDGTILFDSRRVPKDSTIKVREVE